MSRADLTVEDTRSLLDAETQEQAALTTVDRAARAAAAALTRDA